MKDYEINIIIAQACGWTHCRYIEALHDVAGVPPESWKGSLISGLDIAWIPYYCGDLNGMHQAIVSVIHKDPHVRRRYLQALDEITGDQWNTVDATARQRAEAFVKVIGKWVDSPEKEH